MADIYRCTASFAYPVDKNGEMAVCRAGDLVESTSAAYKGHEGAFQTAEVAAEKQTERRSKKADPPVEAATAAPGEKRSTAVKK